MAHPRMLPGEKLEIRLRPHPLSWMGRYTLALFPAIWGGFLAWLMRTEWWNQADAGKWYQVWTFLYGNSAAAHVYTIAGLALFGVIISVATIRWRRFFLYVLVGLLVVGTVLGAKLDPKTATPLLLLAASVPLLFWTEADRLSHRYTLTNLRIIFVGGALVRKERVIKYEAITDLDGTQGPLGRMLNYGTLIPVTQSGFGLGNDTSQASMTVGGAASKGGVIGGGAVTAGGGKEVSTGRAMSFHQLTGVRPYGDTKFLMERLIQEATSTPYLREQVELQRQMVDTLNQMRGGQSAPDGGAPIVEGQRLEE